MNRASFVIPAFNAERWVSKAIYSCRNQNVKKIEIIVVNDGSTDGTGEIIDWHSKEDPRVIPVHLASNAGRSEARNIGNKRATSPIILVLDSDDMATRNRVEDTVTAFALKKCDFLYGSFFVIDGIGNVMSKMPCVAFDPDRCKEQKLNFICHSTVAYTKNLAEAVRYEGGQWSKLGLDDWKFQWEAHRKGFSIKHLKTPLCYYRHSQGNTTNTRNQDEVNLAKEAFLAQV